MNALDKALASLELDDVVPATGVTSADADLDALEALLGVVSENGKNSTLRRATAFT